MEILTSAFQEVTSLKDYFDKYKHPSHTGVYQKLRCGTLVDKLHVANISNNKTPSVITSKETNFSFTDIHVRSVEILLKRNDYTASLNVLTMGFCKARGNPSALTNVYGRNIEMCGFNPSQRELQKSSWKALHQALGDTWILHLLTETSMFLLMDHGCFLQLSGKPLQMKSALSSQDAVAGSKRSGSGFESQSAKRKCLRTNTCNILKIKQAKPDKAHQNNGSGENLKLAKNQNNDQSSSNNIIVGKHVNTDCSDLAITGHDSAMYVDSLMQDTDRAPLEGVPKVVVCVSQTSTDSKCNQSAATHANTNVTYKSDLQQNLDINIVQPLITPYINSNDKEDTSYKNEKTSFNHGKVCSNVDNKETSLANDTEAVNIADGCVIRARKARRGKKTKIHYLKYEYQKVFPRTKMLHRISLKEGLSPDYLQDETWLVDKLEAAVDDVYLQSQSEIKYFAELELDTIAQTFVANHSNFKFASVLKYYCPARRVKRDGGKSVQNCAKVQKIFLFVRRIVQKIVPIQLLGSKHNVKTFLRSIFKLLRMGLHEKFFLHQLLSNIRVADISWIRNDSKRNIKVAAILWWLLEYVYNNIVAYFYVTDSCVYRNKILYYRKSVWKQLSSEATQNLVESGVLEPMSKADAIQQIDQGSALGSAQLRFSPKTTGLRPIISLNHKIGGSKVSVNQKLRSLFQVLKYKKNSQPELCGYGIQGIENIYKKWKKFLMTRRERGDTRKLYFVSLDLKSCYDNIIPGKLFQIMQGIISNNSFISANYCRLVQKNSKVTRSFVQFTRSLENFGGSFSTVIKEDIGQNEIHNAVYTNQTGCFVDDDTVLLKKLRSLLFNNIIRISGQFYRQKRGINQGSILSNLLNDMYHGDMEKSCVHSSDDELMMRQVDDYLFITPIHYNAVTFLKMMTQGIPTYGSIVNPKKTLTNFSITSSYGHGTSVEQDVPFPWCGLLMNTSTLDVHIDYSRYIGLSTLDTLTPEVNNPGKAMSNKLIKWLLLRCNTLLIDDTILSLPAVITNVYQLFVMSAFRFHTLRKTLPHYNAYFLLQVIRNLGKCIYNHATKCLKEVSVNKFILDLPTVLWLCYEAFLNALKRHAGEYHIVFKSLRRLQQKVHLDSKKLQLLKEVIGSKQIIDVFKYL